MAPSGVPWTAYPKTWPDVPGTYTRQLWFDDAEALAAKYDIVLQRDLRGVGIWALGYDGKRPELAALLRGTFDVPRLAAKVSARAIGLAPGGVAKVFAPDGDGRVDKMRLTWTASETAIGRLRILRGTRTVRSYPVAGAGGSIDWNGRDQGGGRAPVGTYRVIVDLRTADGRPARVTASTILVRTAGFPRVSKAGARIRAYSVLIRTRASVRLRVVDEAGRTVRTAIGRRTVSAGTLRWRWNGRTATGARVPAGRYRFVLDATTSVGRETIAIATTMPVGRIGNRQPD